MTPFQRLTSVAAPLPEANIDTDIIFPARFLLIINKKGLGKQLFHERRNSARADGEPFVLNKPPFDHARILVTGANFGVGSSREHAVWALADFGIRCVIASSFGEIFYNNCFKNGVLPIILPPPDVDKVMIAAGSGALLTIDLESQEIGLPNANHLAFDIDPYRRRALLLGLDEVGEILADDHDDIEAFEAKQRMAMPWLFLQPAQLAYLDNLSDGGTSPRGQE